MPLKDIWACLSDDEEDAQPPVAAVPAHALPTPAPAGVGSSAAEHRPVTLTLREQMGLPPVSSARSDTRSVTAPTPAAAPAHRKFERFELPDVPKAVEDDEEVQGSRRLERVQQERFQRILQAADMDVRSAVGKTSGGKKASGSGSARKAPAAADPSSRAAGKQPVAASARGGGRGIGAGRAGQAGGAASSAPAAPLDDTLENEVEDDIEVAEEDEDEDEDEVEEEDEVEDGVEEWPKLSRHQPCAPHESLELGLRPSRGKAASAVYPPTASINANLNQYLRSYQREGVQWLWKQYAAGKGGLLGDDMGLGKTVQVAAFLSAVMAKTATSEDKRRVFPLPAGECRLALIVVPTSTKSNWRRELSTWGFFKVREFYGKEKDETMAAVLEQRCEIVLTTYNMVAKHAAELGEIDWEVTIWDEAHMMVNDKAARSKAASIIPCRRRFGLTGTPMSNKFEVSCPTHRCAPPVHIKPLLHLSSSSRSTHPPLSPSRRSSGRSFTSSPTVAWARRKTSRRTTPKTSSTASRRMRSSTRSSTASISR